MRLALIIVDDEKKASVPVYGTPAVRRLVLLARRAGWEAVHVIGRKPFSSTFLTDFVPPEMLHVAENLEEGRGLLDQIGVLPEGRVLVMRGNHVLDLFTLERLDEAGPDCPLCYMGDGSPVKDWSAMVWLADREELDRLWSGAALFDAPGARRITSPTSLPMVVDGSGAGIAAAEEELIKGLGLATEDHDSFMSRSINRRLSRPISRALAKTGVTANMVTLFNIAIGLAGAVFLSNGHYWSQLWGSLLFLASVILDGVDGEVARLKLQESKLGHYLDIVGDNTVHVAVFAGIAFGLFRLSNHAVYLEALVFLLGGFGLCALAVNKTLGHGPDRRGSAESPWLTTLLANRDFAYLVVVCSLFARLDWFLFGTAFGAYLFAAILFVMNSRGGNDTASERGATARHA
jgi:phosphatidylglycerophosphate synthase